jgi:hypothetical protein
MKNDLRDQLDQWIRMCETRILCHLALIGFTLASMTGMAAVEPLDFRAPAGMADSMEILAPGDIHLEGWLGTRVTANATNRLMTADLEPLLAGFRHKPGSHQWIGEHIGKWLHAATLAWAYTGDPALRRRIDYAAAELIKAQEPDGYLGTYLPEKRLGLYPAADWDVWSHKYCLIGLLTYYQYTGNEAALNASRKAGDLLLRTFGPGRKSILSAGTHKGMAATSVLEPMVLLYRCTGDGRYLEFARYIVQSWNEPNGPAIIRSLLDGKRVDKTADAKAYEMLSNLVGLCELARATGERQWLEPVLNAWQDIADKRLYITGSTSAWERFQPDHVLPNEPGAHLCETCVTVTWMQLNLQLLRLTGEAKFANELEKSSYNHLAAAQIPRGDDWCYYTSLEGTKPYDAGITCCHSSGPRGMALVPQTTYLKTQVNGAPALVISTFETSGAALNLGGEPVTLRQESEFPRRGKSRITFNLSHPTHFAVKIRVAPWAMPMQARLNGKECDLPIRDDGWALIPARDWNNGDRLELRYTLAARVVRGEHDNEGKAALAWGPFVLAYDEAMNRGLPAAADIGLASLTKPGFKLERGSELEGKAGIFSSQQPKFTAASFVPFADAGSTRGTYRVWLRAPVADGQSK